MSMKIDINALRRAGYAIELHRAVDAPKYGHSGDIEAVEIHGAPIDLSSVTAQLSRHFPDVKPAVVAELVDGMAHALFVQTVIAVITKAAAPAGIAPTTACPATTHAAPS